MSMVITEMKKNRPNTISIGLTTEQTETHQEKKSQCFLNSYNQCDFRSSVSLAIDCLFSLLFVLEVIFCENPFLKQSVRNQLWFHIREITLPKRMRLFFILRPTIQSSG